MIINELPSAFTNPAYLSLCLAFGVVGYRLAYDKGQLFREGVCSRGRRARRAPFSAFVEAAIRSSAVRSPVNCQLPTSVAKAGTARGGS